ncbi:MAG: tRNA (adenosine(37)-N6)-dimethylallyltransferase MiaA [Fusobacteriaceae bacterium]
MKNLKNIGIIIAGPTGVGKTSLSIKLAKALNGEIISADSAQVFKGLNIGTGKITFNEMEDIPHHLIDILEPIHKYSVGDFQKNTDSILEKLSHDNIFPIIVGGTGLYLSSIIKGLSSLPPADKNLRETFSLISLVELYARLKKLDPQAAKNIHENNRIKIERALEVCLLTDNKFSILSLENRKNNDFSFEKIALERNRENLYPRINKRVDQMIKDGLILEVKSLYEKYGNKLKSLNIIGYSEIISALEGNISMETAIENIKLHSRRYAKRQFTWFKNNSDYTWYNLDEISEDEIINEILKKYI